MCDRDDNGLENAAVGSGESNPDPSGGGEFDPPPEAESPTAASNLGYDDPVSSAGGANRGDARVREAKDAIERQLAQFASVRAMSVADARHTGSPGVVGVGTSACVMGGESLVVFVESDASEEQCRREMVDMLGVRSLSSDDLPVEVIVTGPIEALSNRSRFRPAPAGASVGHSQITAGTIGGWARGQTGDRHRRLLMVSNNHVIANSNDARFGDNLLQPGPTDGGVDPRDRIAILERFVTIAFGGAPNFVDAATGWCWPEFVRREHVYHRGGTPKVFRVGSNIVEPHEDMVVGKTGRTTDLTKGLIRAVGVSVNVNFGGAGIAHFRDQFAVTSVDDHTFSAGGDSGSFVWQWDRNLSPVGLLFAGGGGTTFCNRMSRVVSALGIRLL